jgi:hypothetical protein
MQTRPVDSSVIAKVGHDPDTNVLEVHFHNGHVHHYFLVPRWRYDALMSAQSIGAYFNREIRDVYRSTRIDTSVSGLDT